MARTIKYRQPTFIQGKFDGFHYWGFIDNAFCGPLTGRHLSDSQQFTGLLDKNGKEIYEEDILSVSRECAFQYNNYIQKGIIKFGFHIIGYDSDMACTGPAYGFYLESISEPISKYDTQKGDSMIGEYVSLEDTKSMEVIGNIYENPELLSKQ